MKPLDIAATAEASGTPVQKSYNYGPAGVAVLGMVSEAEQGIAAKSAGVRPACRARRLIGRRGYMPIEGVAEIVR
jgi:hypothetical protein